MPPYSLDELDFIPGKRARLYRMLYEHGPGNGVGMFLPIDQGLEHGPRDFFDSPDAQDPEFQLRLAIEGNYSAIVFQIGVAEKYMGRFAGRIPLVVKLNGKTEIPPDDEAFSSLNASVEDAVRLGADAVGYTLYVGSPAQDADFAQFREVREEAFRLGMPVIVWAYPRGSAVTYWRDTNIVLRFHAGRCGNCSCVVYPIPRVCGECGARDRMEEVRLAKRGSVYTFALDHLEAGRYVNVPVPRLVLDLDGGGRVFLSMTDGEPERVAIGMRAEVVFRRLHEASGFHNYYWKCRPLAGAAV